jgi:hypothetical protein
MVFRGELKIPLEPGKLIRFFLFPPEEAEEIPDIIGEGFDLPKEQKDVLIVVLGEIARFTLILVLLGLFLQIRFYTCLTKYRKE